MPAPAPPETLSQPDSGLVLRLRELRESDLLVDMFTQGLGRVTAVAKGAKRSQKRFFGLLLSAHYLELQLAPTRGGGLWRLEAARLLRPHLGLRQSWPRWLAGGVVLELLLRATAAHDPQPAALDLALATLARLAGSREGPELASALVIFLARLARELGYGLELGFCLDCGRELATIAQPRLSLEGGLICETCPTPRARPVPLGLVRGLAAAHSLDTAALERLGFSPALLRPAYEFLADFWRQIVGGDLPALDLAGRQVLPRSRPPGGGTASPHKNLAPAGSHP
ncbi:MAG: DNA repair protein RecO [Deltaproteobacteria bacterium]|nr:DNA repair protein RecO [Deltaproteobacteria bacterium]